MRFKIGSLICLGFLAACATEPKRDHSEVKTTASLSQEEATLRAKQVARPNYHLWFGLNAESTAYEGRAVLNFELLPKAKDLSDTLFIDFQNGSIHSLNINGVIQPTPQYDGERIFLNKNDLLTGTNRVEIAFSHSFSRDGTGLHRFEDPVDHRVYLYSNFEPFDAHRMFPCFDQPDLKASFELTVNTPTDWVVISNTQEREVTQIDEKHSWVFPPTPLLSPYVFALHAGPYQLWKSNANGIPVRLFARKSIATWVDAPKWFEITQKGLDFYSTYFGYPFPYSKYDQVIIPEFNKGGMENAAAVTVSEENVFRTKVTQDLLRSRANLILHEMAHMWFGDLVTMRWWNGLWLNESFASYMASKAVGEITWFGSSNQSFFNGMKRRAYQDDQLVTTHPVEVTVSDTDMASAQFDAITYGKGASVLKQLNHYLGEDDFKEGIQRYFQKYALRNTSIHDFIKTLTEASAKNLNSWQKLWLQTDSLNTVQAKWNCTDSDKGSIINQFSLIQGDKTHEQPIMRPHRTRVALYGFLKNKNKQFLKPYALTDITYHHEETQVEELIGKPCPTFVFPNHEDYDYTQVILDSTSLANIKNNLMKIEDAFARQMIWEALWQMVLDGEFGAQDFGNLILTYGSQEKDTLVLSTLLRTLINPYMGYPSVYKFLSFESRKEFLPKIETFFENHLKKAPGGSDIQLIWYRAFLSAASSPSALQFLSKLLNGKVLLSGLKIDQERRWEIIETLARGGYPQAEEVIASEEKKDPTDFGKESAIASEVSIPTTAMKKAWLEKILKPVNNSADTSLSVSKLREAMWRYHLINQESLSKLSMDTYFETIPKLTSPSLREFAQSFVAAMYPGVCDSEIVTRTTTLLEKYPDLPTTFVKTLKMRQQREEQCVRARARMQKH